MAAKTDLLGKSDICHAQNVIVTQYVITFAQNVILMQTVIMFGVKCNNVSNAKCNT